MAKKDKALKKAAKAAKKASGKAESKDIKKARKQWQEMENAINEEFAMLAKDGYDPAELETLRWDYRYEKLDEHKLSRELLEFFVAEGEARAAGRPLPRAPGAPDEPAGGQGGPAAATSEEYKRKSEVDLALVERYLERRVSHDSRSELESVYKEAFGEDLVVPRDLDLVDLSYHVSDISEAHRQGKLSKAEILGVPDDAKPEAAKAEAKAQAAPAVKKESRAIAAAMAFRKGVPKGPTRDEKWSVWNPFKFWVIPKRYAGDSVPRYYVFLAVNLVIFIGQFVLIFIPFILRLLITGIRWIWARFLKQRVGSAIDKVKEKAAVPPAAGADAEKKAEAAKSS